MISLGDIKTQLNYSYGTAELNLATSEARENAINKAIERILKTYDIANYDLVANISFTSGVGSLPTSYFRYLELYNATTNETYYKLSPQKFRFKFKSPSWTIKDDGTGTNTRKAYIYPEYTTTLAMRYIKLPARLSDDSDECLFDEHWKDAIADLAAVILLENFRNYNEANVKQQIAKKSIGLAWSVEASQEQGYTDNRLESVFEAHNILNISDDTYKYT